MLMIVATGKTRSAAKETVGRKKVTLPDVGCGIDPETAYNDYEDGVTFVNSAAIDGGMGRLIWVHLQEAGPH